MDLNRKMLAGLLAGGALFGLVSAAVFRISLVLNDGRAFIPNYEERLQMFKALKRRPRPGSPWTPRQGDNWIF
jgi:hypothetical protein